MGLNNHQRPVSSAPAGLQTAAMVPLVLGLKETPPYTKGEGEEYSLADYSFKKAFSSLFAF